MSSCINLSHKACFVMAVTFDGPVEATAHCLECSVTVEVSEFGADRVEPAGVPVGGVEGQGVSKVPWDLEAVH